MLTHTQDKLVSVAAAWAAPIILALAGRAAEVLGGGGLALARYRTLAGCRKPARSASRVLRLSPSFILLLGFRER